MILWFYEGLTLSIENKSDMCRAKQIMKNWTNIIPLINAISLCERQNLSIRGHSISDKI